MSAPGGDDLARRAQAAYFRTGGEQSVSDSRVVEHDDKLYVVLRSATETLAVYRVRNDGVLRRMRRPPVEVEHGLLDTPGV